jgi:hypothetical protein
MGEEAAVELIGSLLCILVVVAFALIGSRRMSKD